MPAKLSPAQIAQKRAVLDGYARAVGRDPAQITTALQSVVCLARTPEEARAKLENSAFDLFRKSLRNTMTKGVDIPAYIASNLIGTPDQVCEKVAAYQKAGVEHFSSLLFVGNTVDEMADQIRAFARHVVPAFDGSPRWEAAGRSLR